MTQAEQNQALVMAQQKQQWQTGQPTRMVWDVPNLKHVEFDRLVFEDGSILSFVENAWVI